MSWRTVPGVPEPCHTQMYPWASVAGMRVSPARAGMSSSLPTAGRCTAVPSAAKRMPW